MKPTVTVVGSSISASEVVATAAEAFYAKTGRFGQPRGWNWFNTMDHVYGYAVCLFCDQELYRCTLNDGWGSLDEDELSSSIAEHVPECATHYLTTTQGDRT